METCASIFESQGNPRSVCQRQLVAWSSGANIKGCYPEPRRRRKLISLKNEKSNLAHLSGCAINIIALRFFSNLARERREFGAAYFSILSN